MNPFRVTVYVIGAAAWWLGAALLMAAIAAEGEVRR